jgi:uncharacterized protein (TIGR02001 family)
MLWAVTFLGDKSNLNVRFIPFSDQRFRAVRKIFLGNENGVWLMTSVRLRNTLVLGLVFPWQMAMADWHGSLAFLSDYQYRGYSKSRSNPVVQGNLDYEHADGWYAGATLSNVSFDDKPNASRASLEARVYAGWGKELFQDLRGDLSVAGYLYDGKVFDKTVDYAELQAAVTYQNWLTARVALAPDAYQSGADVFAYELSSRHDIWDTLQWTTGVGFHQARQLLHVEYFYWNTGLTWHPLHSVALDVRYSDAQTAAPFAGRFPPDEFYPRPLENKWQLSVTVGF